MHHIAAPNGQMHRWFSPAMIYRWMKGHRPGARSFRGTNWWRVVSIGFYWLNLEWSNSYVSSL